MVEKVGTKKSVIPRWQEVIILILPEPPPKWPYTQPSNTNLWTSNPSKSSSNSTYTHIHTPNREALKRF